MKRWVLAMMLLMLGTASAQAAEFSWHDANGASHSLTEFRGKSVLVHFWASWCPPCRAEMPELVRWLKMHPEVTIVPVSMDTSPEAARKFLDSQEIDFPVLLTGSREAMKMGVRGLPTTVVVDASGQIVASFVGGRDWSDEEFSNEILASLKP